MPASSPSALSPTASQALAVLCAVATCNLSFLIVLSLNPGYAVLLVACCIIGLSVGGTYPL